MYELVRGPLLWVAFAVLVAGGLFRLIARKGKGTPPGTGGLASRGFAPFDGREIRVHPVMTLVSLAFHASLLLTPLFVMGHAVLWRESWGIRWWSLPEGTAHMLTLAVVLGGLFFALQWLTVPEVRRGTARGDWALLAVVILPFLTGFLARQQIFPHETMAIIHILTGVLWLVAIPFTGLLSLVWFGFGKAYMGRDYVPAGDAGD